MKPTQTLIMSVVTIVITACTPSVRNDEANVNRSAVSPTVGSPGNTDNTERLALAMPRDGDYQIVGVQSSKCLNMNSTGNQRMEIFGCGPASQIGMRFKLTLNPADDSYTIALVRRDSSHDD